MTGYGVADVWPPTETVDQAHLIEAIGWDALLMLADGRFTVEKDEYDRPIGLRIPMRKSWWVIVLNTANGYSIGRYRGMVPFEWVHEVPLSDLTEAVQTVAANAWLSTPDDD